jgi:hypothetical protein
VPPSPFNGRTPAAVEGNGPLRVIISGHLHGASSSRSGLPAATVLAALDTINALGAHLFLSTGDLFMDREEDIPGYQRALFDRLRMPLYNVPGNHDLGMRSYVQRYGPTHGVLDLGRLVVVLLDTERDNGDIKGEQLATLTALADTLRGRPLLVLAHRPLWAEDDPQYADLFRGNTRSAWPTNFRQDVAPLLEKAAARVPVYWVSGSMAGGAPASIFFHRHAPGITFVQTAIRDEPRDALLVLDIGPDGRARWSALSLTGRAVPPVETLDADHWRAHGKRAEPFNWRLLPYLTMITVRSAAFWWGVAAAVVLGVLVRMVRRRWL